MTDKKILAQISGFVKKTLQANAQAELARGYVNIGWPAYDEKEIMQAFDSLLHIRISQGPKVAEFEKLGAAYVGTKYAVAVNSGSSANLLALSALVSSGAVPVGSEVIIPATTFSTVASPIIQVGLIPVYVDVDSKSWNINPAEITKAITKKTRVIMPVHTFGNPADMPAIMRIAKQHNLLVLEDCCEAHGASLGKKKAGSFGDLATQSFFVAHNITTGEGGMVFTNQKKYYELLVGLREFGRLPATVVKQHRFDYPDAVLKNYDARYIFNSIGYNVRMTDIAAALGIEQIKKLDALNARRLKNVQVYNRALAAYQKFIQLPEIRKNTFHNFYGYPFVIKPGAPFTRLELTAHLEKNNIETRPFFAGCLPDQPGFRNQPGRSQGKLPVARWLRDNGMFIGCHPALTSKHLTTVIKAMASWSAFRAA